MSKELKAFRKICRCLSSSYEFTDEFKKNKKLIETALKNYEKLNSDYSKVVNEKNELCVMFAKEHRALEIIKKYPKCPIQSIVVYEKNKALGYDIGTLEVNDIPYTQEEYDLLREVLL